MLSKKVTHKKIKPQLVKDKAYLSWLHESGQTCMVCSIGVGLEAHHVKRDSSDKRSDDNCIVLCWNHHHGTELSPHGTPTLFRETYPIESQRETARQLYITYKEEQWQ